MSYTIYFAYSAVFKLLLFEHPTCLYIARAIENQCYVLAAAQFGKHNEKRDSFGHSLVSTV